MIQETPADMARRLTALEAVNNDLLLRCEVAESVMDRALGAEDRALRRASRSRRLAMFYRDRGRAL